MSGLLSGVQPLLGAYPVGEVRRLSGSDARGLGGRVHRDKDDGALADGGVDVGGEEEVAPARLLHHLLQPRLVDGQVGRVPRCDAPLVEVADRDLDIGALEGDDGHGGPAHVPGTQAADLDRHRVLEHRVVGRDGRGGHGAHGIKKDDAVARAEVRRRAVCESEPPPVRRNRREAGVSVTKSASSFTPVQASGLSRIVPHMPALRLAACFITAPACRRCFRGTSRWPRARRTPA